MQPNQTERKRKKTSPVSWHWVAQLMWCSPKSKLALRAVQLATAETRRFSQDWSQMQAMQSQCPVCSAAKPNVPIWFLKKWRQGTGSERWRCSREKQFITDLSSFLPIEMTAARACIFHAYHTQNWNGLSWNKRYVPEARRDLVVQ